MPSLASTTWLLAFHMFYIYPLWNDNIIARASLTLQIINKPVFYYNMSSLWFSLWQASYNWQRQYEELSHHACSIRLLIRTHLPMHTHIRTHTYTVIHPVQPCESIFHRQICRACNNAPAVGPSHYWDRLVRAVKTPASPIPIIDCTSSAFASRKPSPPEHLSEICGGSQLEVGF